MRDRSAARRELRKLHECLLFRDVVATVERMALPGDRTPYSGEAVQKPSFHNASGIHSLRERQPSPLSHFMPAKELQCPSAEAAHTVQADMLGSALAVAEAFHAGKDIAEWRQEEPLQPLQEQLDRLKGWDARLNALKPASVAAIAGEVPIATIVCLVKALKWPHRSSRWACCVASISWETSQRRGSTRRRRRRSSRRR